MLIASLLGSIFIQYDRNIIVALYSATSIDMQNKLRSIVWVLNDTVISGYLM